MNILRFRLTEAVAVISVFIFGVVTVSFIKSSDTCERQAKRMNMRYYWNHMEGCMIEVKPGQWVPLKNYRVM